MGGNSHRHGEDMKTPQRNPWTFLLLCVPHLTLTQDLCQCSINAQLLQIMLKSSCMSAIFLFIVSGTFSIYLFFLLHLSFIVCKRQHFYFICAFWELLRRRRLFPFYMSADVFFLLSSHRLLPPCKLLQPSRLHVCLHHAICAICLFWISVSPRLLHLWIYFLHAISLDI